MALNPERGVLNTEERAKWAEGFLSDRNVKVTKGQYYASFVLETNQKTIEDVRREALGKLTKEEINALGLNE